MNGDREIPSSFKAIIEECALRATEEDIEGVPEWERFRVISHEAGLLIYIVVRATRRKRIAELAGAGGSASTIAWLAGAASAIDGEVTGWETNPRRLLKLQNCLCRSRLSPNVNLCSFDPIWERSDAPVLAPPEQGSVLGDEGEIVPHFDCVTISLAERDCVPRMSLGWDLLEPGGLMVLTDTLKVEDGCAQAVGEFFAAHAAAVAGVASGEGVTFAYKLEQDMTRQSADEAAIGMRAAGALDELRSGRLKPGVHLLAIPPETGRFLWMLVRSMDAKRVLEIGAGGGYSGTWVASALAETKGHLTTMEIDPVKIAIAKESYEKAGVAGRVTLLEGDAFELLKAIEGSFDFIFLDSEKNDYLDLFEVLLPMLREGGLLVADNVVSHAEELKLYVDTMQHSSGLASMTARIGSGEEVTLKL